MEKHFGPFTALASPQRYFFKFWCCCCYVHLHCGHERTNVFASILKIMECFSRFMHESNINDRCFGKRFDLHTSHWQHLVSLLGDSLLSSFVFFFLLLSWFNAITWFFFIQMMIIFFFLSPALTFHWIVQLKLPVQCKRYWFVFLIQQQMRLYFIQMVASAKIICALI